MLIKGDCLIESNKIETASVDLILTDLPYGMMKGLNRNLKYGNRCTKKTTGRINDWDDKIDTEEIFKIAERILRPNGKMLLFSQGRYTAELIMNENFNISYCYTLVWDKCDFANPLMAPSAPVSYYENIVVFKKLYDLEFKHPVREYASKIKEFTKLSRTSYFKRYNNHKIAHFFTKGKQFSLCTRETYNILINDYGIKEMPGFLTYDELLEIDANANAKSTFNLPEGCNHKSNIFKYKKETKDKYHPTQKPIKLLEDLIKTFSNEQDLVVDLTMGSGSTGVACNNTNRRFIGIELDDEYFEIAERRIRSPITCEYY